MNYTTYSFGSFIQVNGHGHIINMLLTAPFMLTKSFNLVKCTYMGQRDLHSAFQTFGAKLQGQVCLQTFLKINNSLQTMARYLFICFMV